MTAKLFFLFLNKLLRCAQLFRTLLFPLLCLLLVYWTNSSQLLTRTRLLGETIIAFSMAGFMSGLWRSSVHSSVIVCSVLPSPMSSAMMQPKLSGTLSPVAHSYMNFTPSRWCGRRTLHSIGSTTTWTFWSAAATFINATAFNSAGV